MQDSLAVFLYDELIKPPASLHSPASIFATNNVQHGAFIVLQIASTRSKLHARANMASLFH
eukprot:3254888-Pleurochrysis_carterae.AAC.4